MRKLEDPLNNEVFNVVYADTQLRTLLERLSKEGTMTFSSLVSRVRERVLPASDVNDIEDIGRIKYVEVAEDNVDEGEERKDRVGILEIEENVSGDEEIITWCDSHVRVNRFLVREILLATESKGLELSLECIVDEMIERYEEDENSEHSSLYEIYEKALYNLGKTAVLEILYEVKNLTPRTFRLALDPSASKPKKLNKLKELDQCAHTQADWGKMWKMMKEAENDKEVDVFNEAVRYLVFWIRHFLGRRACNVERVVQNGLALANFLSLQCEDALALLKEESPNNYNETIGMIKKLIEEIEKIKKDERVLHIQEQLRKLTE